MSVSSLIDGISRQNAIDASTETESDAEEYIHIIMYARSFEAYVSQVKQHSTYLGISGGTLSRHRFTARVFIRSGRKKLTENMLP